MSSGRGPGRPRGRHATDARRTLIDAARRQFAEHGYAATTTRGISDAAGMQPGNLRHHLGNKAEVFDIVYDDSIGCVGELLAAELSRNPSPQPGDLVHLVGSMLEGEPDLLAFLALAPLERRRHPELRNHLGDGPAGLETLIRDAVHGWAGQGRVVEGVDPDHLVDVLLAVTYGLLVFATQVDPTVDRPGAVEVLARLIDGRIWRSTG